MRGFSSDNRCPLDWLGALCRERRLNASASFHWNERADDLLALRAADVKALYVRAVVITPREGTACRGGDRKPVRLLLGVAVVVAVEHVPQVVVAEAPQHVGGVGDLVSHVVAQRVVREQHRGALP